MKRIPWQELPGRFRISYLSTPFLLVLLLGLSQLISDLQGAHPDNTWLALSSGLVWSLIGPYLLLSLVGFGRLYWLNPLTAGLLVLYELVQGQLEPHGLGFVPLAGIGAGYLINWWLCAFVYYARGE